MPTTTSFNFSPTNMSPQARTGYPLDNGSNYTVNNRITDEWAVEFFGTGISFNPFSLSQASIDLGAFDASSGGSFADRTAATGLTDAWHTLIVRGSFLMQKSPGVKVTSDTTPAIRFPAATYGISYEARAAATQACVKMYGAWGEGAQGQDAIGAVGWWDNGIIIRTTGSNTGLRVCGQTSSKTFDLYVDGSFYSTVVLNVNWGSQLVASGLTPGAHTYDFRPKDVTGETFYFASFNAVGGLLDATAASYGPTIAMAGDSIAQNSANGTRSGAIVATLAASRGWERMNLGIGGATVPTGASSFTLTNAADSILRIPPKCLIVYYGSNDANGGKSAAQFKIDLQAYLQKLLDGTTLHSTGLRSPVTEKVIVMRPLGFVKNLNAAYDQATLDAVAALTLPESAPTFVTVDASAATDNALHPNQSQTNAIAAVLDPYVPSASVNFRRRPGSSRIGTRTAIS